MVTVVDPNGTPVPVYTRSGTTIQEITANGTTLGAATPIVTVSGWTVVVATISDSDKAVLLPEGNQIGDVVEIHAVGTAVAWIFPASGDSINSHAVNEHADVSPDSGCLFRKISSTKWLTVGHAS